MRSSFARNAGSFRTIFVTAFDSYAVRAFEVHALDYLLKPVEPARLAQALARAREPSATGATVESRAKYRYDDFFFHNDARRPRFLRMLAEGGALDGVRILGRKTIAWMTADHLGDRPRLDIALPPGYGFGLGVAVRTAAGLAPDPGSVGSYGWSGSEGTLFVVDPAESMWGLLMVQAPLHNERCWSLFRQGIHAALVG